MKKIFLTVVAAITLIAASLHARAETITFEDMSRPAVWVVSAGGFFFYGDLINGAETMCHPACPDNGTSYLLLLSMYSTTIEMRKADGGTFNLLGFDGAGSLNMNVYGLPQSIPSWIVVTGALADGSVVYQSFDVDKSTGSNGALNFTTNILDSKFSNLVSVSFQAIGYDHIDGFSLDNISVSAVPEPGTYAMPLGGLAIIAFAVRCRRKE
jgi:hypothetical protein